MSRWMVNVRGQQFSTGSLDELKQLAKKGEVGAGDIVQPPGAADWLYAMEVPELKKLLRADVELDLPAESQGMSTTTKTVIAVAMGLVSVGMWVYALQLRATVPDQSQINLIGEKGMKFSEVLVTNSAPLRSAASVSAPEVGPMEKNGKCDLLAKRDRWYKLRCDGKEGYAQVDNVVPAYFFADNKVKEDYDPLYNPDRYVTIANSAWRQPLDSKVSNFSFMIQNGSKFPMTDLRLKASVKDKNGGEVQSIEIPVEGTIPPQEGVMVGTLKPAKNDKEGKPRVMSNNTYSEILKEDPKAADRWIDGVDVDLTADDLEASVEIVEVRAIPPEGGSK
jgi:GYF domain 2